MASDFESRTFEPAEQGEVIRLAARLQAEHAERLTGRDLEVIASEVGISPTFVRAAADKVGKRRSPSRPRRELSPTVVQLMSSAFVIVQFLAVYSLMSAWTSGSGNSSMTTAAVVFALMLGVSKARLKEGPGHLARMIVGRSIVIALLCGAYVRLSTGQVSPNWWPELPMVVLVQVLVAGFGYFLGTFAKEVRESPQQVEGR